MQFSKSQIFKLFIFVVVIGLGLNACINVSNEPLNVGFTANIIGGNTVPPASVQISNQTTGADFYEWSFPNGKPYSSKEKNPPAVLYENPGTYKITLTAWNIDDVKETKEVVIQVSEPIKVDFSGAIVGSIFPPVEAKFTNLSKGGNQFNWTFEGGNPATSTDQNPSVFFEQGGDHKVSLKVGNGLISKQKDSVFVVTPNLLADFDFVPDKANLTAPLTVKIKNKTVGASSYFWTVTGGDLMDNSTKEPTLYFKNAGTYTVTLEAFNDKKSRKIEKSITVQ
jgi:PKD repeat protein